MNILVINGPNMGALGKREVEIYGDKNWETVWYELNGLARKLGVKLEYFQSNHEGAIIDKMWENDCPVIINAGGLSHTSVALYDCIKAKSEPCVEVHITNVFAREPFRQTSIISAAATGVIAGFGTEGYLLALRAICNKDFLKNLYQKP